MNELYYKSKLSFGAIYSIDKLGGIPLSLKYFELNRTFIGLPFVDETINIELFNFFNLFSNPPIEFLQFNEIFSFYYFAENKLTRQKLDSIIFQYNSNLNLDFASFINKICYLDEKEIKELYKIGGVTSYRISMVFSKCHNVIYYLNLNSRKDIIDLPNQYFNSKIEELLINQEASIRNLIFKLIRICNSEVLFMSFIFDSNFIDFFAPYLSESERKKFNDVIQDIILFVYEYNFQVLENKNSIDEIKSQIKEMHSSLLDKYSELLKHIPESREIKKSRIKSKFETISKLFVNIENI